MTVKVAGMRKVKTGKLRAFCTVVLDGLEITDVKLVDGANGLFVGMPSSSYVAKDGTKKYTDIVKVTSKTLLEQIQEAVVAEYHRRQRAGSEEPDYPTPTTKKLLIDSDLDEDETDLPF